MDILSDALSFQKLFLVLRGKITLHNMPVLHTSLNHLKSPASWNKDLGLSLCWGSVYSNWNTTGGNSDRNQCLIAFQEWESFFCLLYFSATRFSHNFCKVAGGSHYKCRIQAFQKVFTNLLIFISTSNIFKKVIKPPSWDLLLEKV